MILRRLSQSIKEQNWAAITIEFVLLIVGVFLGIQVANWNEARQERAQEVEYITRLHRDFSAIEARLVINMKGWERASAATIRLINDLDTSRQGRAWPRSKAEMLDDLNATMGGRIPAPRAASYVELLSAGRLGLLRDSRLREALADYDTQAGFTMKAYDVLVQRVDPQRPTLLRHMRYDRGADVAQLDAQDIVHNGGHNWADLGLAQLGSDPGLETALNSFASASHGQALNARLQQEKSDAVMALLAPVVKRNEGKQP